MIFMTNGHEEILGSASRRAFHPEEKRGQPLASQPGRIPIWTTIKLTVRSIVVLVGARPRSLLSERCLSPVIRGGVQNCTPKTVAETGNDEHILDAGSGPISLAVPHVPR